MNNDQNGTNNTAKSGNGDTHPGPSQSHGPGPHLMSATSLIGDAVCNRSDESIGDIKELMLNMHSGRVSYAVLSFGGFLGMGDKLFAVPWDALTLDAKNKRFVLDVEKDRLETAPGFNKDSWPNMADTTWVNSIHAYYGIQPNGETTRL